MVIGKYSKHIKEKDNLLIFLQWGDMAKAWKRCSMTADYGADYLSRTKTDPDSFRNTLSMIINELLENAVKYGVDSGYPIELRILVSGDRLICQVDNCVRTNQYQTFRKIAKRVIESDEHAYLERLAEGPSSESVSQIGLLTLINFFKLTFGFRFKPTYRPDLYSVSVQTEIRLSEIKAGC